MFEVCIVKVHGRDDSADLGDSSFFFVTERGFVMGKVFFVKLHCEE